MVGTVERIIVSLAAGYMHSAAASVALFSYFALTL